MQRFYVETLGCPKNDVDSDKIVGSLEVGKRADIVGLGADPFEVSPPMLHEIPVALTMMDGRVTHDDQ